MGRGVAFGRLGTALDATGAKLHSHLVQRETLKSTGFIICGFQALGIQKWIPPQTKKLPLLQTTFQEVVRIAKK